MSTHSTSAARVAANQENATHSTGPASTAGKAKSSQNAVTHALTGRTVLLPADDLALYERHLAAYANKWQPVTDDEKLLVQSIADTDWRLSRIPQIILVLQAKAREEMENEHKDLDPALRTIRIELEGLLKYDKQFRNLQLQESRLHRRREKDAAELRFVMAEREARRARELEAATKLYLAAEKNNEPFDPATHGFDFSICDIQGHLREIQTATLPGMPGKADSIILSPMSNL